LSTSGSAIPTMVEGERERERGGGGREREGEREGGRKRE
jgi:hypothetical protein